MDANLCAAMDRIWIETTKIEMDLVLFGFAAWETLEDGSLRRIDPLTLRLPVWPVDTPQRIG
jgi:hypothetical protein